MKELATLKRKFGTWTAVAKHMGITYRQLINVRNGKGGHFLIMRIRQLAVEAINKE